MLKCNAGEARWLLEDPEITVEGAAEALHGLGPELVVVTDRHRAGGRPRRHRGVGDPPPVEVVSPLGAGDAFMGTLAAGLHATGFDLSRAEDALRAAADAAARTCTHLGAFDAMSGGGERGYARGRDAPNGRDRSRRPRSATAIPGSEGLAAAVAAAGARDPRPAARALRVAA